MCYFSGYELGKRITPRDWGVASDLMTGTIAQTVAGIVFCPIDIVKQRVQTISVMEGSRNVNTTTSSRISPPIRITPLQAAQEVWQHQGARGFFRGYWTMNALWMPWNLIYLSTYEEAKRRVYKWQLAKLQNEDKDTAAAKNKILQTTQQQQQQQQIRYEDQDEDHVTVLADLPMLQVIPAWAFPLCSSSCAAVAAVATHPIDVVKTRLQVLTAAEKGQRQRSAWQVAGELWRAEGVAGFTRGAGARIATLSIGSSMSWWCYEMVKRQLACN